MKEAKSSIHIEAGKISVFMHNDRSISTANAIFDDEVNEYNISGVQALQKYYRLLKLRIEVYTKRTGQKLNKKTITHFSVIVNIKRTTTMRELRRLAIRIEMLFDTIVVQIAIHRDEGHVEDGKHIKNYHAHLEFIGIDSNGYSIRRKLTRSSLSQLQDITADILKMQRGTNYAKEKKKRPKRLDTHAYKQAMIIKEKAVNAVKQEFSLIIEQKDKRIEELSEKLDEESAQLKKVTRQKKSVDTALTELLPQLELNAVSGRRYSYAQVKELILEKFTELNREIEQLQETNKKYHKYAIHAKKMYVDLENQNILLEQKIEMLGKNSIKNIENNEDDDEEIENSWRVSY
ncbi:hypothetical protein [Sulfurimonas sp. NWX79]|uniref:hypothetical protein n=1 Tax=Sulfurimonas sp. NWX79 TaxID=2925412 RepID=UPI003204B0E9